MQVCPHTQLVGTYCDDVWANFLRSLVLSFPILPGCLLFLETKWGEKGELL